jgi:hypothetical protein
MDSKQATTVPHAKTYLSGTVCTIYDIACVKIRYGYANYKTQKLAEINIPPYINESKYISLLDDLAKYMHNKVFKILQIDADTIYMYYDDMCINTLINNMLLST